MAVSPKAIKLERVSEAKAKLVLCSSILASLKGELDELDIDEEVMMDFASAKSRIDYVESYVSDIQKGIRVTIAEFNQKLPNSRREKK